VDINALPPNQYKAALYLLSAARGHSQINIGKSDLAEALGISAAQAGRLLSGLVESGLIERVRRGRYIISSGSTEHQDEPSGLINEPSRLKNEPSGLTPEAKFTVPVVTNTTNTISRTTSSKPLLTSNEVNKARSAGKKPARKISRADENRFL